MLKKTDLIELGATEELAENVLKAISAEITGNFIPKSRFDEVNQAKKNAAIHQSFCKRATRISARFIRMRFFT